MEIPFNKLFQAGAEAAKKLAGDAEGSLKSIEVEIAKFMDRSGISNDPRLTKARGFIADSAEKINEYRKKAEKMTVEMKNQLIEWDASDDESIEILEKKINKLKEMIENITGDIHS